MELEILYEFRRELASRGFKGAKAPNGTMALDDGYLSSVGVRDLMAQLMLRREKLLRLADVVGADEAKRGYADVSAAIDALKVILETLDRPRSRWTTTVTGKRRGTSPLRRP